MINPIIFYNSFGNRSFSYDFHEPIAKINQWAFGKADRTSQDRLLAAWSMTNLVARSLAFYSPSMIPGLHAVASLSRIYTQFSFLQEKIGKGMDANNYGDILVEAGGLAMTICAVGVLGAPHLLWISPLLLSLDVTLLNVYRSLKLKNLLLDLNSVKLFLCIFIELALSSFLLQKEVGVDSKISIRTLSKLGLVYEFLCLEQLALNSKTISSMRKNGMKELLSWRSIHVYTESLLVVLRYLQAS